MSDVEVVIPTKNRAGKLARCIGALEAAREQESFNVLVCDSGDDEESARAVADICGQYPWVRLARHTGTNVAAARNACIANSRAEILINVDDDIQVGHDAIDRLSSAVRRRGDLAVVAGSVRWDGLWSAPLVTRPNGYSRFARPGEAPSFLIGAFFGYRRTLATALPWNEHIRTSDDRFMGALWRCHGVELAYEPEARAIHDVERVNYPIASQDAHIYTLLFDTLIANPHLGRALMYSFYGLAVNTRTFVRRPGGFRSYVSALLRGQRLFLRDIAWLRSLTSDVKMRTLRPNARPSTGP